MATSPESLVIVNSERPAGDMYTDFETMNSAPRIYTEVALASSLRNRHPDLSLTTVSTKTVDLLGFARAGNASAKLDTNGTYNIRHRIFEPATEREKYEGGPPGKLTDDVLFAHYTYTWKEHQFLIYIAKWRLAYTYETKLTYILHSPDEGKSTLEQCDITDGLILEAAAFLHRAHDEILVFDDSYWQKSNSLWKSVQNSTWDDVILDETMKTAMLTDMTSFFDGKEVYEGLGVPWKRGILIHGTPGNGKTATLKALMNWLSKREGKDSVPTLYVKSFNTCKGPQGGIMEIFSRARKMAPCLLVLEDLDSLVTDKVRSYFLNELDGIESNNGILVVGSTNHLEKLDPALSKRPSRFDRKYFFPIPGEEERKKYCSYWIQKLQAKSSAIKFPKGFCDSVAEITEGFSFAYMKEIFVSSLLHIAGHQEEKEKYAENGLESSFLWNVVQQQIKVLRAEMASLEEEESEAKKKEEKKLAKKSLVKKVLERATSGNLEVDSSEDDDDDDGCA